MILKKVPAANAPKQIMLNKAMSQTLLALAPLA